jgi:phosphopantetheine--protein transferase-like protein
LKQFDLVAFLNRSLHTYGYKAALLKSFGFGQVGGEVVLIHPDFVFSQLTEEELANYEQRRNLRQNSAFRYFQNALTGKSKFVQVKTHPPFHPSDESLVYLNPLARASFNPASQTWQFKSRQEPTSFGPSSRSSSWLPPTDLSSLPTNKTPQNLPRLSGHKRNFSSSSLIGLEVALREMGEGLRSSLDRGIGIDAQLISEIDDIYINNADFINRNFTEAEIEYCRSRPDPSASFAGRWAAKEAVIKAISSCNTDSPSLWKGAGASLKEIEILQTSSLAPKVVVHGHAQTVVNLLGISYIKVAISHSGQYAIAQAICR